MDSCDELNDITRAPWGEFGRVATLALVSGLSKLWLKLFNTVTISNADTFLSTVMHRQRPVGLITISNHTSTVDDPALLSAITPWTYFLTGEAILHCII